MDPLVIACFQKPIVFFMTRSDVFKPMVKPILASANMLPIYRQMDGGDTAEQNKSVFVECYHILKTKRSPLLFGEGITDDIFERRLKPIKKGSARMAFGAMEYYDWNLDLSIQCLGLNYEDPTKMRGNLLIKNAAPIKVADYKNLYLTNTDLAIDQLTRDIEKAIQAQITHIENSEYFEFHDQIMRITYRGMHYEEHDKSMDILERQAYSKRLADEINVLSKTQNQAFLQLKQSISEYFNLLKIQGIKNSHVYEFATSGKLSNKQHFLFLILMWPFVLIGILLMGIPYWITKRTVEKKFKRKVFWLSTKMVLGLFIAGLYNIAIAILFYHLLLSNIWATLLFYFTIPAATFLIAHQYKTRWIKFQEKRRAMKLEMAEYVTKRAEIIKQINLFLLAN
jgi:hypothetical protein